MKNKKIKKVIGINTGHNGGCALCVDGKIIVAISEERLTKKKNTAGWMNALTYCLSFASLDLLDVDLVVFSSYRDRLPKEFDGGLGLFNFPVEKCISVDHHLSHASSVFFTSPFKKSLIFIYDGHGNDSDTESFYVAEGIDIKRIGGNPILDPKNGITRLYEAFTTYFGWTADEAGKTMGLSSYGNHTVFNKFGLYSQNSEGLFFNNLEEYYSIGLEKFIKKNKINCPKKFSEDVVKKYSDMAAWLQKEFERAIIGTIKVLNKKTKINNLCLAGGGALNSVCNRKILNSSEIKKLYIFPAAGDAGQCVGNALYGYHVHGRNPRNKYSEYTDFLGKNYSEQDTLKRLSMKRGLRENTISCAPKFSYQKIDNIEQVTAKLLSKGKIIGWFQNGSELGPRALGNRSILCDPRGKKMKDTLNLKVKGRESFRPFAASVLEEKKEQWFDLDIKSPFMLFVSGVNKDKIKKIPAVVHVDNSCRIQTVNNKQNSKYYKLIKEFYNITGVPLVLNTSFNLAGFPIVETPTDAIQCFLKTKMDYLVIGNILIKK